MKSLAKTFIIPARQNQFIRENIFNNDPVHRITIACNTNSAFTGVYVENPFRHQQFGLRQNRIFIGCQPIVDVHAGDNCSLQVRTKKTNQENFPNNIPSIPIDKFENHYVQLFDLTSMKDATESCQYPELAGEPLKLELNFSFLPEHVTELIVLVERMSLIANDSFVAVKKNIEGGYCFSPPNN